VHDGKRDSDQSSTGVNSLAVVAERLGFKHDEALSLGKALAGLNARSKGQRLGIFHPSPKELGPPNQLTCFRAAVESRLMSLLKNLFVMLAVLFGMLVAEQLRAEDLFMGEYEGTFHADRSQKTKATAKVIAEGPSYYRVVLQAEPLMPGEPTAQFEIYGVQQGTSVNLFGRANSAHWQG
jgi:hypothetical protein